MIEVEKRALLDEAEYKVIEQRILELGGEDKGQNDTESVFYIAETWQAKIQHQISKGGAKIAWKSGGLDGSEAREEIEVALAPADTNKAAEIISRIAVSTKKYITSQKRHDYTLNAVDIAVKFSDDWGYHVELDCTIEDSEDRQAALRRIQDVASLLELTILTQEAEEAFIASAIAKRNQRS